MDREQFLARVKQAVQTGNAYRVALKPVPPDVGYVGADADLCGAFAREVEGVGGFAEVVDSDDAALAVLGSWLDLHPARSALCWPHPVLDELGLFEWLRQRGVEVVRSDEGDVDDTTRRERWLAADVGITSVEWAIAETGSLVMWSRRGRERVASLVPPVHIAVVRQRQIVPDLLDVFRAAESRGLRDLPSNMTLITGPSKTGDIELQLTTGVHGPGTWRVLVIRDA